MSGRLAVEIQIASSAVSIPESEQIESWIDAAIELPGDESMNEISVRVVDEEEGREINHRFRGADEATNVLSFPAGEDYSSGLPPDVPRLLGDIVICGPVVEREAAEQGKSPADHWAHMLVHGALHLQGYDHEADDDAAEMEAMERSILATGGVTDPYAA